VGGIIFLGWPFAIVIVWFFRHDRRFAVPAILFLVAEGLLATNLLVWPGSQAMFAVCVAFGGVFCIAAIRAWVLWIRERS
jgi:O-antigen/teichoic acid export membrane protein